MPEKPGDQPRIRAMLLIRSDGDPAQITRRLKIKPDRVARKGEVVSYPSTKSTAKRACSIWEMFGFPIESSNDTEDYVKSVIKKLGKRRNLVAKLDRRIYNVTLDVCIDVVAGSSTPALGLSAKTMKILSNINVPIDIDLYVWKKQPPKWTSGKSFRGEC